VCGGNALCGCLGRKVPNRKRDKTKGNSAVGVSHALDGTKENLKANRSTGGPGNDRISRVRKKNQKKKNHKGSSVSGAR